MDFRKLSPETLRILSESAVSFLPDKPKQKTLEEIENDDYSDKLALRRDILSYLKVFFAINTIFVSGVVLLQGIKYTPGQYKHIWFIDWNIGFELDSNFLNIYVTATLVQLATMLILAIRQIFRDIKYDKKSTK